MGFLWFYLLLVICNELMILSSLISSDNYPYKSIHLRCLTRTLFSVIHQQTHHYKTFFGQIQDLLFHPDGKTFFSAAEILKRNSLDKAIIAWDFQTTAVLSNQISQVSVFIDKISSDTEA